MCKGKGGVIRAIIAYKTGDLPLPPLTGKSVVHMFMQEYVALKSCSPMYSGGYPECGNRPCLRRSNLFINIYFDIQDISVRWTRT